MIVGRVRQMRLVEAHVDMSVIAVLEIWQISNVYDGVFNYFCHKSFVIYV